VWGELGEEEFTEILVDPVAEKGPDILMWEICGECSDLQLEEVVLGRVHVHCVNAPGGSVQDVTEDVVSG